MGKLPRFHVLDRLQCGPYRVENDYCFSFFQAKEACKDKPGYLKEIDEKVKDLEKITEQGKPE